MAKSKEFIRSRLVNFTNASCSDDDVKDSRYHYYLKFNESVGFDWIEKQITKCSSEVGRSMELYKIRPSGIHSFEIEVRELERRNQIDENQNYLGEYE